jgi:hypothetical protein
MYRLLLFLTLFLRLLTAAKSFQSVLPVLSWQTRTYHRGFTVPTVDQTCGQSRAKTSKNVLQASSFDTNGKGKTALTPETSEREIALLHDALQSFSSPAANELVNDLGAMRTNGTDPTTIDIVLNNLLSQGPDKELPFWTLVKPLARLSRRARMASLRRTLDLTTPPPPDEVDEANDTLEEKLARRRRALVLLLRQLASAPDGGVKIRGPAIRWIENKARREAGASNTVITQDLLSRRPEGLETPTYSVLESSGPFEIRKYEPFTVCSVLMKQPTINQLEKPTDSTRIIPAGASAFNSLAGYLFGKNTKQQAMKMTMPVLSTGTRDQKRMSFVMPSDYWSKGGTTDAPQPLQGSGVTLETNDGGVQAVLMFGGYASKKETEEKKKLLLESLARSGHWEPVEDATTAIAQYNDPFTPPWKRLNEVSIPVRSTGISQK